MTEPETEGKKCKHGRNLVRTYCPCFILRTTMDKLLASQKSDLLAKVVAIINEKIKKLDFAHHYDNELLTVDERDFAIKILKELKKRISEELK